jgi:hypothetical protein
MLSPISTDAAWASIHWPRSVDDASVRRGERAVVGQHPVQRRARQAPGHNAVEARRQVGAARRLPERVPRGRPVAQLLT